jgi:hypothetical protein
VKGKIRNLLKIDVAATLTGSIVLCDTANPGDPHLIFGFGQNNNRVNVPQLIGMSNTPAAFLDPNFELASVHCGYDSCFGIQKANKKIFYSW